MKKITMLGQAVLAASIIAAPVAIMNAATASAQPTPAPAEVCFDWPYASPPPPWVPGTVTGCGWRSGGRDWRGEGGRLPAPAPNWKYVGPGCQYSSNPNWQYTGPDCQRENP